jgi:hypothetical protein
MIYAHAGHWLVNLLYAAPLLFVIAIIVRDRLRQRREDASEPGPEDAREPWPDEARDPRPEEATLAGPVDGGAGGGR